MTNDVSMDRALNWLFRGKSSCQSSAVKMCFHVYNKFFYTQFLKLNILVSIKPNNLKYSKGVSNIFMQGRVSKNINLGPSSHFMK